MMQIQRTQAPCLKLAPVGNKVGVQMPHKAAFTAARKSVVRNPRHAASMIKAVAQEPAAAIPSPSQGEVRLVNYLYNGHSQSLLISIVVHCLQNEWYALVASADFYFNDVQNEALAEQLRELKRYYEEQNREIDFFFVSKPDWLNKYPDVAKRVNGHPVALVSTDKQWIT